MPPFMLDSWLLNGFRYTALGVLVLVSACGGGGGGGEDGSGTSVDPISATQIARDSEIDYPYSMTQINPLYLGTEKAIVEVNTQTGTPRTLTGNTASVSGGVALADVYFPLNLHVNGDYVYFSSGAQLSRVYRHPDSFTAIETQLPGLGKGRITNYRGLHVDDLNVHEFSYDPVGGQDKISVWMRPKDNIQLVEMWANLDGNYASAVTVGQYVYVATQNDSLRLYRIDRSSRTVSLLHSVSPVTQRTVVPIAASQGMIYWASSQALYSYQISSGTIAAVGQAADIMDVAATADSVYVLQNLGNNTSASIDEKILRHTIGGSGFTQIVQMPDLSLLDTLSGRLFWIQEVPGPSGMTRLYSLSTSDQPELTFAAPSDQLRGVVLMGTMPGKIVLMDFSGRFMIYDVATATFDGFRGTGARHLSTTPALLYFSNNNYVFRLDVYSPRRVQQALNSDQQLIGSNIDSVKIDGAKIYWLGTYSPDVFEIYKANLDGSLRETIYTGSGEHRDLVIYGGRAYMACDTCNNGAAAVISVGTSGGSFRVDIPTGLETYLRKVGSVLYSYQLRESTVGNLVGADLVAFNMDLRQTQHLANLVPTRGLFDMVGSAKYLYIGIGLGTITRYEILDWNRLGPGQIVAQRNAGPPPKLTGRPLFHDGTRLYFWNAGPASLADPL